jgi:hypothetical protein
MQTMVDQWEQFDRDISTLDSWLDAALIQGPTVGGFTEGDSRNISILKTKMDAFLVS